MRPEKNADLEKFLRSYYNPSVDAGEFLQGSAEDPSTRNAVLFWRVEKAQNNEFKIVQLARGVNRYPENVNSNLSRWIDRSIKYKLVLHSETDAISTAAKNGTKLAGSIMSVKNHPCAQCASLLAEIGISKLVMSGSALLEESDFNKRWAAESLLARDIMKAAGIQIIGAGVAEGVDIYKNLENLAESQNSFIDQNANNSPIRTSPKIANLSRLLQNVVNTTELIIDEEGLFGNKSRAAMLFDPETRQHIFTEVNRLPAGVCLPHLPAESLESLCTVPERFIVAKAARDGISIVGKAMYCTHHPIGQAANMIIQAGIKEIYIDGQTMQSPMDKDTAQHIDIARVIMNEGGARVHFVNHSPDTNPYELVGQTLAGVEMHEETRISLHSVIRRPALQTRGGMRIGTSAP